MRLARKFLCLVLATLFVAGLTACGSKSQYKKFSTTYMDAFDTVLEIMGYCKTQKEFDAWAEKAHQRFVELDHLYDIYNNYDGLNNIKTINDNAGKAPIKVAPEIIDLISFSIEWYDKTPPLSNIALGAPLSIWHQYREAGIADPEHAELPPMDKLKAAAQHTDIHKVIVDKAASTVYLEDPEMSLDVGTVAKGYATELIAQELKAEGWTSFIVNAGGNVRVVGKPLDGVRQHWGIGITNPDKPDDMSDDATLDTVFCTDMSVVTSGDYQRYYMVDGKRYCHIIDPNTLMPADRFRAVTIVTEDSGLAYYLDTILFVLPYEEGLAFIKTLPGIEALWVFPDGTVKTTDGLKPMMKKLGGATSK